MGRPRDIRFSCGFGLRFISTMTSSRSMSVMRGRTDSQRMHRHFSVCEGFRMTAHHDDAAGAGAVVRKPPVKETAIGGTCGGAAGFDLSGVDRCRRDPPAQLLRYGTEIAIGRKRLWHPV